MNRSVIKVKIIGVRDNITLIRTRAGVQGYVRGIAGVVDQNIFVALNQIIMPEEGEWFDIDRQFWRRPGKPTFPSEKANHCTRKTSSRCRLYLAQVTSQDDSEP